MKLNIVFDLAHFLSKQVFSLQFVQIIFFMFFFQSFILSAAITKTTLHPEKWKNNEEIVKQLQKSQVKRMIPMQEYLASKNKSATFTSIVFFVELEDGLQAVFKPDDAGDSYFEEVAYKISCHLGFPYIPPTIIRTIDGTSGSLQLFVSIDHKKSYEESLAQVDEDDLNNLKLFYFVFGQWDIGKDNLLFWQDSVTNKMYPIAIDNNMIKAIQKVRYAEHPYVAVKYSKKINSQDFDTSFPFDQAIVIEDLSRENIERIFGSIMPLGFIEYFPYHRKEYKYVFYQNYLWRQFHFCSDDSFMSWVETCSLNTYHFLKSLNLNDLIVLYKRAIPYISKGHNYAKDNESIIQEYFSDILDRRNQVIAYLERKNQNYAHI